MSKIEIFIDKIKKSSYIKIDIFTPMTFIKASRFGGTHWMVETSYVFSDIVDLDNDYEEGCKLMEEDEFIDFMVEVSFKDYVRITRIA